MNNPTRAKATGRLQVCNFCRSVTEPILSADPAQLLTYKCKNCGSIGALKRNEQGEYYTCWTMPKGNEKPKGVHDLLAGYTLEQMLQLISDIEAETGHNEHARQICNKALQKRGEKPVF